MRTIIVAMIAALSLTLAPIDARATTCHGIAILDTNTGETDVPMPACDPLSTPNPTFPPLDACLFWWQGEGYFWDPSLVGCTDPAEEKLWYCQTEWLEPPMCLPGLPCPKNPLPIFVISSERKTAVILAAGEFHDSTQGNYDLDALTCTLADLLDDPPFVPAEASWTCTGTIGAHPQNPPDAVVGAPCPTLYGVPGKTERDARNEAALIWDAVYDLHACVRTSCVVEN